MLWKVLGVIVLIWVALALVTSIVKAIIPVAIIGLIIFGAVTVYRNANSKSPSRL